VHRVPCLTANSFPPLHTGQNIFNKQNTASQHKPQQQALSLCSTSLLAASHFRSPGGRPGAEPDPASGRERMTILRTPIRRTCAERRRTPAKLVKTCQTASAPDAAHTLRSRGGGARARALPRGAARPSEERPPTAGCTEAGPCDTSARRSQHASCGARAGAGSASRRPARPGHQRPGPPRDLPYCRDGRGRELERRCARRGA